MGKQLLLSTSSLVFLLPFIFMVEEIDIVFAILAGLLSGISVLILYARWNYGFLEKLGIPVVNPHFLFGSTFNTRFNPVGYRNIGWMKKYGPVFGVYEGREPQVYICDPELVRLVMVKYAHHFDAQGPVDFGDSFLNEVPDYLPNAKWRIVRSFTSPVFTGAKLRMLSFPMKETIQEWGDQLTQQIKDSPGGKLERCAFDDLLFDGLTDVTLRCLFSIKDTTGRFPSMLKTLAKPEGLKYINLKAISDSFPFLLNFLPPTRLSPTPAREFLQVMNSLIASRTTPNSPPDVVDICIAQLKKLSTPEYQEAKMTKETILCQAFNFFFSGQDETSLVISAMIYHLLTAPPEQRLQDKLLEEIDNLWEDDTDYDGDGLGIGLNSKFPSRDRLLKEAPFLQACIMEALRLYPFNGSERVCTKSWTCEKYNFTIPEGITVLAPLWAVNRNPDYFEDPEVFKPERFLLENRAKLHAYAWSSFGHGPRQCTGKPLAMEVLRMACAYIFRNFEFHLREDSKLEFLCNGPWVFINHEPIYFDISLRNNNNL